SSRRGQSFNEPPHRLPKLRQHAEVFAEQAAPILWRRLSIRLPGHAGDFEMIAPDFDASWLPVRERLQRLIAQLDVGLKQRQLRHNARARLEAIQQLNEHELCIR